MNAEKRLRAANQLVSLSTLADDPLVIRAQDKNFNDVDWHVFYQDASDDKRTIIDFVRVIVNDEPGCDAASLAGLNEYDRAAVIHGLTLAYTNKEGIENG